MNKEEYTITREKIKKYVEELHEEAVEFHSDCCHNSPANDRDPAWRELSILINFVRSLTDGEISCFEELKK